MNPLSKVIVEAIDMRELIQSRRDDPVDIGRVACGVQIDQGKVTERVQGVVVATRDDHLELFLPIGSLLREDVCESPGKGLQGILGALVNAINDARRL